MNDNMIYPLTVIYDRYRGTYSGGKYTAWKEYPWDIPQGVDSSDGECMDFWMKVEKRNIGIGNSAQEAIDDLIKKNPMPKPSKNSAKKAVISKCCKASVVKFQGYICKKCGFYCEIVPVRRGSNAKAK